MGHRGRRRSRRHPHQQRRRRLARTKQRSHRSRVRRDLCTERQGSVLPRRVTGTGHGRARMGSIVTVSTMVASFRQAGTALYGASRAALELLTKTWAAEHSARGVRVNAVAPGPTRTRMMEGVPEEMVSHLAVLAPAARVAEPEELAAAIVFLARDDASFVHGVTLAVDEGRVAT